MVTIVAVRPIIIRRKSGCPDTKRAASHVQVWLSYLSSFLCNSFIFYIVNNIHVIHKVLFIDLTEFACPRIYVDIQLYRRQLLLCYDALL
jgi:hypothetical protein